jgi:phospholipid-binding lipoprotein MlaA
VKKSFPLLLILVVACAGCRSTSPGKPGAAGVSSPTPGAGEQAKEMNADLPGIGGVPDVGPSAEPVVVSDPLEPVNRAFFYFNDKLYFWLLKPVSKGYSMVVPQPARRGVKNFFSNIATPVRLVNCTLQAEFEGAWVEVERFAINTTIGVVGFGDPARNWWNMEKRDADLGQTLGRYRLGPSIYINWPILGPSCVRDTVGYVGDLFLDPVNYLVPKFEYNLGIKSYDTVNGTSLRQGEYEDFKNAAIDPYVALRDAYYQYRRHLVEDGEGPSVRPPGPLPTE